MNQRVVWAAGGLLALGLLVVGLSVLSAQRPPPPDGPPRMGLGPGPVGRYVVARNTGEVIVILDTVTGELYRAVPPDFRPYDSRPRFPERPPLPPDRAPHPPPKEPREGPGKDKPPPPPDERPPDQVVTPGSAPRW